jgi:hypothetical protein
MTRQEASAEIGRLLGWQRGKERSQGLDRGL